jgi:hypothetical protein
MLRRPKRAIGAHPGTAGLVPLGPENSVRLAMVSLNIVEPPAGGEIVDEQ